MREEERQTQLCEVFERLNFLENSLKAKEGIKIDPLPEILKFKNTAVESTKHDHLNETKSSFKMGSSLADKPR